MSTPDTHCLDPGLLAEAIAYRVREHPSVAGLHGGPFDAVTSYLPGRKVVGVRIDEANGSVHSVQLCVVVQLGAPLPQVAADLRQWVAPVAGPVPVHITIADLSTGDEDEIHPG